MEQITLNAEFLFELQSKQQWINRVPNILPEKQVKAEQWVWVDSEGYIMAIGEDFMVAENVESYPVKVFRLIRRAENKSKNSAAKDKRTEIHTGLTKEQAEELLIKGYKISHEYYEKHEYIYMMNGCLYDENRINLGNLNSDFWQRTQSFTTGWMTANAR